ncbi:MAG: YqjK-like family protein [Burkholderiales bacterium]
MNAIALRKQAILARIARQRRDLAREAQILKPPLAAIDRGIAFARYLKEHPLVPALAAAALFVLKPARTFRWLKRGWFFWSFYKNAREKLASDA